MLWRYIGDNVNIFLFYKCCWLPDDMLSFTSSGQSNCNWDKDVGPSEYLLHKLKLKKNGNHLPI